jgi:polyhydroxyalkanoate synthesis regulator protein
MSDNNNPNFDLPKNINAILRSLCAKYDHKGLEDLKAIVMGSEFKVIENTSTEDKSYGHRYGHSLQVTLPEYCYERIADKRVEFQNRMRDDLNSLYDSSEFIADVLFQMENAPALYPETGHSEKTML